MHIPLYKMSKDELEKILKGRINGEFEGEGNQKRLRDELKAVHEMIRPILDKHGIYGYDRSKYHGFAQSLYYRIRNESGIEVMRIAEMRISYFKYVHRLDEKILREIAEVVTGFLPY
jgi:hypothetical protein